MAAVILLLVTGAAGLWLLFSMVFPNLEGFFNLKTAAVVIVVTVVGSAIFMLLRHAASQKSGLILDRKGLTDHSNIASVGFVPWTDITEIKEARNGLGQRLIIVKVTNPDLYIEQPLRMQASRKAQYKQFGSPIIISAAMLNYDPQALLDLLRERARK